MMFRDYFEISTTPGDMLDITENVLKSLQNCVMQEGTCNIFIPGSTAGLILNEYDQLLLGDLKKFFNYLADKDKLYAHPDNAHSHLRSSIVGSSKNVPFSQGNLILGTWQQVIFCEFDTSPRKRKVIVTVNGD
ncbi:secondary thiamine-phosphate synthase enzyme YjbQ [Candidatus Aenigmatarchaeota archaeon]